MHDDAQASPYRRFHLPLGDTDVRVQITQQFLARPDRQGALRLDHSTGDHLATTRVGEFPPIKRELPNGPN
ncbi:hypothetical protein [Ideonella sp. A 288]|uniref:hypothetical protein n=1 Tax=Ideonella sp. A 288 TaxID=1962181 RepID=UPI001184FD87|nr:hypothetical protein [Ideonella sp. A 288]